MLTVQMGKRSNYKGIQRDWQSLYKRTTCFERCNAWRKENYKGKCRQAQNTAFASALNKAIASLEGNRAKLLGCVLNNVYKSKLGSGGGYGYGYGYGSYHTYEHYGNYNSKD